MTLYATIDDVRKRGLPEPSPTDNEILETLALSQEIIDQWCGQTFEKLTQLIVKVDGNGGDRMIFGCKIRSVQSLIVDGNSIPAESIANYEDNPHGELALLDGYLFNEGKQNVVLTASAGFNEVPFVIEEASAHLAAMILNRQLFGGRPEVAELKSESMPDYKRERFTYKEICGIIEQDTYLFGLLRPYRLKGDCM